MKLGFLTACLPRRSLAAICAWASTHDFDALEVVAWPDLGDRPFTATHLNVDGFGEREADGVRSLFDEHGLECSSVAYYDNNLDPDHDTRRAVNEHVHRTLSPAPAYVVTGVPGALAMRATLSSCLTTWASSAPTCRPARPSTTRCSHRWAPCA